MKNKFFKIALYLFLILSITGCTGKNTIVVWNGKDLIGFAILGIIAVAVLLFLFVCWVQDLIIRIKKSFK